jgi:ketosteroid isomerase-like protein
MMRRTWPLAFTLLLASIARGAQTPEEARAEADIRQALAGWVEAANRGDWKAALKVWAPDLIGWYPGAPDDTYAREAENAARAGEARTKYELEIKEVIVAGSLAVVRDVWKFTTRRTAGEPTVETVKSFEVWRRQPDGAWRISRWISAPEPKP